MPVRIESCFKYVSTLSCDNPVWQTIPRVDNPVSKAIFTQIIFKSNLLQPHIITSSSKCARIIHEWYKRTTSVSYFPGNILYFSIISPLIRQKFDVDTLPSSSQLCSDMSTSILEKLCCIPKRKWHVQLAKLVQAQLTETVSQATVYEQICTLCHKNWK